ncbi:MAG: ferredoxin reductase family protein [Acidobacteria bacterium]|nr:ferredoxin reductase family protein [Acidobacteriota bacterium]
MSTTTKEQPEAGRPRSKRRAAPTPSWHQAPTSRSHLPGRRPQPYLTHLLELLTGVGFALVVSLGVSVEGRAALASAGGWPLAIARVSAFAGSYLLLVMVILTARLPWLERTVGQDTLVRWHRKVAPYAVSLISLHVLSVLLGYSQMLKTNVMHMLWSFWVHYPDMLSSSIGFVLLLMAAFTSIRIARSKMKYETWWVVHLYTYLGLALAFMHQIRTGVMFLGHENTIRFWTALWVGTGIMILVLRVGVPLARNKQYQLRVASVTKEAPNVYSLTVTGKNIRKMAVSGGQFFQWRFMAKGLWWHSHPYSLSALPRPPFLRVTVKGVGDQSSAVAQLKPGTRVFVEGPYGVFTHHATKLGDVTLIAAGVGITPIRAMLEDLPAHVNVNVIIRATRREDIVHAEEMKSLVASREGRYHEVVGSRDDVEFGEGLIESLVPTIRTNDVFVCGPRGFTDLVVTAARRLGIPHEHVHSESFSF